MVYSQRKRLFLYNEKNNIKCDIYVFFYYQNNNYVTKVERSQGWDI